MISLIATAATVLPSLVKLFDSDERKEGVRELTQTVVKEASKVLGVPLKDKDDLINTINANPELAIKLKAIENKHSFDIEKLYLEDVKDSRKSDIDRQNSKASKIVKVTGSLIALFTVLSAFILDVVILTMVFNDLKVDPIITLIAGANNIKAGQVLSFYFGSSKNEADKQRGN